MEVSGADTLTQWVNQYTQDLYNWAVYKVSDSALAQDLVQDTFLAAFQKMDSFKRESAPKTWLFSILNNKIVDHYRAKVKQPIKLEDQTFSSFFNDNGDWKVEKRPKDWHSDEKHLLDDDEFQKTLKKCLEALPEKWNACVKLKFLMNKNGDEICQELDISPTNFWQIMHRAKLNLRDCVESYWFNN